MLKFGLLGLVWCMPHRVASLVCLGDCCVAPDCRSGNSITVSKQAWRTCGSGGKSCNNTSVVYL